MNLITVHFKTWNFNRGSPGKDDKKIALESDKKGSLATQWNVRWNISKIQYLTPLKLHDNYRVKLSCNAAGKEKDGRRVRSSSEVYSEPCQISKMECPTKS